MRMFFDGRGMTAAALLLLAVGFSFAACSIQEDMGKEDTEKAPVTSQVYGYILEVNETAQTILADRFELVSAADREAVESLGLTENDRVNGYYLCENGGRMLYPLADGAQLVLSGRDYLQNDLYLSRYGEKAREEKESASADMHNVFSGEGESSGLIEGDKNGAGGESVAGEAADELKDKLDEMTENGGDKDGGSAVNGLPYQGTQLPRLSQRIAAYEHIPFRITLSDGKVVRIEEMGELYDK